MEKKITNQERNAIMKKMYKKPIVEQAEMLTGSIVMAGSPTGLPISGGGGGTPEPIPDGGGGD